MWINFNLFKAKKKDIWYFVSEKASNMLSF